MSHKKDSLSDAELMRYARQIILPEWGVAAQLKLVNASVVIVGMGGLGCPIAQTLARAGVGVLKLVDFDHIEASNLQRQHLFTSSDLGKNKAKIACNVLKQHNEFVQLTALTKKVTPDSAHIIIQDADLVIDATDNFTVRDALNMACFQSKIPLLSSAAVAQDGQLALYDFGLPNQPCYRCVFGGEQVEDTRCSELGVLTSTTQLVGAVAAHVALHFLGLGQNLLPHKLLVFDGKTLTQRTFSYQKDPHCSVCAAQGVTN